MAKSWFVKPETVVLQLPEGQWVEVKKRLTVGESRKVMASLVSEIRTDGRVTPNFEMAGKAEVLAYLVDWSLRDEDGKPVRIDTDGRKSAAIDNLAQEHFDVIAEAIQAHIKAMSEEREAEKNAQSTSNASEAISTSAA